MESNKDEASKCISIAKVALGTGDYAKALRFAEKSIRLYPTSQAEQLVTLIKNQSKNEPNKQASSPRTSSSSSASHKQASGSESTQERKYTAEQVRAVKTILACGRDYYKVLAVEKTATDAQIKKAYRKQALQFHPDKNSAPGADEAFKLVAKAFDVLSDSNKRAIHDQGGDAEMSRGRSSGYQQRHHSYAHNRRYGEEVSPEDIFNMFFGGGNFGPGYRAQQQHHHRQRRYQQQQQDDLGFGGLAQMMPIIFLVLVAIFALLFSVENEPLYTFYPTATNNHLRNTKPNHVNYYVNPKSFDTQFKNNGLRFKRIENQIESDWLHELRVGCQSEQRLRANLLAQANGLLFGLGRNEQAYKRAENMKLEKCDDYRKLAAKIGRWG